MTQKELAEAVNRSADVLSKIERGLNSPGLETVVPIARALSLDLNRLFEPKRTLSIARVEQEAQLAQTASKLDDHMLAVLNVVADALKQHKEGRDKPPQKNGAWRKRGNKL